MSQDLTGGRHFDDFTAARNDVFSGFREAASALKPVEFGGRRLEVLDVGYDATDEDDESERFNYASQAAAVRDKRTLGRRLRGTFRMTDLNTGQVLDEKRSLLATVPRVNEDGTMIYRGARYNVVNQQRLKPGIFGRVKKNQELETFVNSVSGPVGVHRYLFTPASGRFYVNVGNSRIPLTTMLKTLGATDDQIKAAWGEELASKNVSKNESQDLNKLYQKLVPRKLQDPAADKQYKQMAIRQVLDGVKLDKWSVKRLLGVETDKLTPDLILKATAKTLAMSRGDSEGDDRDHLAYQSIHSVEDLLKEYVANDVGFEQRNAMRKVLRNSNLKGLQPKLLQKQIEGVIFGSGLGIQPEYANPLDAWDRATRITKMGFGGIGSTDALPMESRDYHISHQAFLDPARTSECLPPYAELMTKEGWVRADELTEDLELACLLNGRLEYHSPQALNVHDFDGELYGFKSQTTAYEVTGEHRMWSRCCHDGSVFRFELARDLPGKQRLVMCGGHAPYIGSLDAIRRIKSPKYAQAGHQAFKLPTTFAVEDWAEFLGWFVSEGSTGGESYRGGRNSVCISQVKSVNPENWHRIFALLSRMGLKFSVSERAFQICNTHLASYLHRLGTSDKKYIPDEIFEMPVVARQKFLEAALLGDGGYYKNYDSGKRMYFTTSRDLADDMQFLAFGLGYSTKIWVAEDLREERYKDVYVVMLHTRNLRRIGKTKKKEAGYGHYRRQYKGKVYCPTVPGGLIYCRVGDYGGIWMGNSLKVGVDLNVVSQAVKGKDGKLRTPLLNNRTGKIEYLSAEEVVDKKVAFSNKQEVPGYVIVNKSGRESYVKPEEVDYVVPHAESVFSGVANLIPMKMHQPHNRSAMGSRFLTQSLPIKNREQPWVQSAVPGTNKSQSFYRLYSHRVGAIESKVPGKVKSVSEDRIVISTEQGDKVHWLNRRNPLGSKSQLNNTPVVKPGDVVQAGDLLASSNFTDDQGNIAVGLNASVAIMPWGDNYEDAYTISESFAKRMAGLMSYEYESRADGKTNTNKNDFLSALPRQFSRSQLGQIDDDGVVKVGTKLNRGDPILLGMKKKETNLSKKLARSGHLRFMDQSQTWEHDYVGEVTGVHRNKRGDKVVTIEAETPLKAGDKLGALYGSKGVVAILPDDQMVHDKNGKPFDIASSDLGFISRQNSSRALAMMLGKIAQKRGKPYLVEELEEDVDLPKLIREELKAEGLSATETVVDPVSGRQIEGVLTGPEYMLRLAHTAESKSAARGTGAYGQDEQPSKGSGDDMQAKRLSNQELGALVSHGAWEYLRDAALVRGQRNDEYVARFVNGYDLPPPKVPLVYQKFLGYLQGMGVNPVREGSKTKLLLMGDKDVEQLAGDRKLISAETVNLAKNMKPIKGGLFDQAIFGEEGNRFAYFELADPIPHPLMEDVFRNLMGTTKQGFRDILAGRQQLGTHGTGPGAISKWLEQLKPAQELSVALRQAQGASKTKREAALKRIRFLQGMVKQQIDPKDLMLSKVPIIPPKFRPVSKLADKDTPLVDGMNLLYQEMVSADENLRSVRDFSSDVGSERLAVYDAVQAAVGLRQPLSPELRQKQVKGIMARLKGGSPKTSYVQSKLLSGTVDDVGRAVILPNAKLKLDEIGLPEEQAWKIFEMPVLRRLRRNNIPLMEAKELIANRHERARRALLDEMEVRPITASRAPILHKYGKMAFMPKLVKGRSLQVNPLVYAPLGADNDGDAMNFHAIISDEAVAEAKKKMLPSKNLLSPKDFETPMFVPNQDHALGIYLASAKEPRGRPVKFANKQAAMAAFKRGQIAIDTPIEIIGNS